MEGIKVIATNRKASYEYFLSSPLECGIALKGTEIKSLKVNGRLSGRIPTSSSGIRRLLFSICTSACSKREIFSTTTL